ncbi:MAG: hypothetical protein JAY74_19720, partial [Candidatus Thiodiazotropha taylori]|nr:hypothetical protein [Candidatus Thiodiazotropha taylori]
SSDAYPVVVNDSSYIRCGVNKAKEYRGQCREEPVRRKQQVYPTVAMMNNIVQGSAHSNSSDIASFVTGQPLYAGSALTDQQYSFDPFLRQRQTHNRLM